MLATHKGHRLDKHQKEGKNKQVMLIKIVRLLTIVCVGFGMGPAIGHLLEMPAKMTYEGVLWLKLLQTLYPPAFGPIGGTIEGIATLFSILLAFLVRHRRPAFGWTLMGTACMVAAHTAFWIWVAPVNSAMLDLTPDTLPTDWASLRNQWEYTHATRAILQFIALGAFTYSILVETPKQLSKE